MLKLKILILLTLASLSFKAKGQSENNQAVSTWVIGESLGREFFSTLDSVPGAFETASVATAEFGSSSAFYLGDLNGKHYFGAAAHSAVEGFSSEETDFTNENVLESLCLVFPSDSNSARKQFKTELGEVHFTCLKAVFMFPEVDFVLFEAQIDEGFEAPKTHFKIRNVSLQFGQSISLFSYSSFDNPGVGFNFALMRSHDELCRVLSSSPMVRAVSAPLLEGWIQEYSVSYVAIGCDSYPGDSGGPVVDNETGELVGLLSAGTRNKTYSLTRSESLIESLSFIPDFVLESLLWTDLTYMVPIDEIYYRLSQEAPKPDLSKEHRELLSFLLEESWIH